MHAEQRFERYSGCVATIQIRDVPEDVHRTYRLRAAAAGMSLQELLRMELIRNASLRTPAEVVVEVEARLASEGHEGRARRSTAGTVRSDRASH